MKKGIKKVVSIAIIMTMVFALGAPAFASSEITLFGTGYATGTVTVNGYSYACSGSLGGSSSGVYTMTTCAGSTIRYSQVSARFITDIYGYDAKSNTGSWTSVEYTGTRNGATLYPTYPNNTTGLYAAGGVVGCCHDDTWWGTV